MPDTCVYKDRAGNTQGGPYPVRVTKSRDPVETTEAGRTTGESFWTLTHPAGTVVKESWRAHVTFTETGQQAVFHVVGILNPSSYQTSTQVKCTKVT